MSPIFPIFILISTLVLFTNSDIITTADFLYQPSYTKTIIRNNYVGLVLNLSEIISQLNTTSFQGYILNSNLKGSILNNFKFTIRMPRNWYPQCTPLGLDPTNRTSCQMELSINQTFLNQLGEFVWNTASQPYWIFGINNENIGYEDYMAKYSLFTFLVRIYTASYYQKYDAQMMVEGDLYDQNGMRNGNYTPADFINEAAVYPSLVPLTFRAPGLSEYAGPEWMATVPEYYLKVPNGVFTFEPIIFLDPALATIDNLLSDNYTRGYLQRRVKLNSSYNYDFKTQAAALTKVRLTPGEGIDGITNTFAAAVWWIDFVIQSAYYGFIDVGIEGARRNGNFQSVFGGAPDYAPTALYYGSLMAILAVQSQPKLIKPGVKAITSSKIKMWGFESAELYKILIINKDKNPSLNGRVQIQLKANAASKLTCIYLQAPSLAAKSDQMTIGGHKYIGGDYTPQGSYMLETFIYDANIQGFSVRIGYAQVALCEIPSFYTAIPTKSPCYEELLAFMGLALTILIII